MRRYIYILLSQTPSGIGKAIRRVMRVRYNHASVALDEGLCSLCSFARLQYVTPFVGGPVKERLERLTLRRTTDVPSILYRVPVSEEQYTEIVHYMESVVHDRTYRYNLLSAMTYPLLGGFHIYKTFTCIEFVMDVLSKTDIPLKRPIHAYQPQDLTEILSDYVFYEGNLLDYRNFKPETDSAFFAPLSPVKIIGKTAANFCILSYRLFRASRIAGFLSVFGFFREYR